MPSFDFVGGAYEARSKTIDAQQCINLYPEISGVGNSKSVSALIGTPGLSLFSVSFNDGYFKKVQFPSSNLKMMEIELF